MADDFKNLIKEIEDESRKEGVLGQAQAAALRSEFAVANELLTLRRARRLSQQELSQLSGVPQSEISRIERGAANPTHATLVALASPLGARPGLVPAE